MIYSGRQVRSGQLTEFDDSAEIRHFLAGEVTHRFIPGAAVH
jgi:hypothetical protein